MNSELCTLRALKFDLGDISSHSQCISGFGLPTSFTLPTLPYVTTEKEDQMMNNLKET